MSRDLPIVTDQYKVGNQGIRIVHNVVEGELKWIFRLQTNDFGIDAEIEVVEDSRATGRIIAAQIKCGETYFENTSKEGYVFRPKEKHIQYWLGYSLPVIVIICRPSTMKSWWVEVCRENVIETRKGHKMIVPFRQMFNASCSNVLSQIARRTSLKRQQERNRILSAPTISDREFIELILRGGVLMGFTRVTSNDYRAMAFSQDYMPFQSDSFYDLETWKNILGLSGVEDWEIEEALEKVYS